MIDYSRPEYLPPSRAEREAAKAKVIGSRWLDERTRRKAARSQANMKRANGQREVPPAETLR